MEGANCPTAEISVGGHCSSQLCLLSLSCSDSSACAKAHYGIITWIQKVSSGLCYITINFTEIYILCRHFSGDRIVGCPACFRSNCCVWADINRRFFFFLILVLVLFLNTPSRYDNFFCVTLFLGLFICYSPPGSSNSFRNWGGGGEPVYKQGKGRLQTVAT